MACPIKITDYCDQANLSTKERLDLFIKVCQAIQHAHQKGIIHRDIKPSNILVTLHDGVPVPKVIDFGIAKATEGKLTDATVYTQLHQFIGTPAYMSPEQAEMSGLDIDTRSDIYSLGVLLYELLTGKTPFDGQELMSQGIDAMRKTIREKDPVRPSTKLRQTLVAANMSSLKSPKAGQPTTEEEVRADSRRLQRVRETITALEGDLDWIVMKCLEKDRTRRYDTANGVAMDLRRYLDNEPVTARPPSSAYRIQKAFSRNKLAFSAGIAISAALVLGTIGTSLGLVRAERQRQEAEQQRHAAEDAQKLAEQRFSSALQFVTDVSQKVAPKFENLIGATKANQALAQISLTFLQSLGQAGSMDETYQTNLAQVFIQLSDALGMVFSPNAAGDYDTALRFANQSLALSRDLLAKRPADKERLRAVARAEERVGILLEVSNQYDEALLHMQRFLEMTEELAKADPDDAGAVRGVSLAHLHYAAALDGQGHKKEALEQVLHFGKEWLGKPVIESADPQNSDVILSYVTQWVVGQFYSELDQPSQALPLFEQALEWNRRFADHEPNNARWPRDWCTLHGFIGKTQIALGRYDEGMTNLQVAVDQAEKLVARDDANALAQQTLADLLQDDGNACIKLAALPDASRARQSELLRRATLALTRSRARLDSPQLKQTPQLTLNKQRHEIEDALAKANDACANLNIETSTIRPANEPNP